MRGQVNGRCLRLVVGSLSLRKVMVHFMVDKNSILVERETTFAVLMKVPFDLIMGSLWLEDQEML